MVRGFWDVEVKIVSVGSGRAGARTLPIFGSGKTAGWFITGRVRASARYEPSVYHDRPIRARFSELTPHPFSPSQAPQQVQPGEPVEEIPEAALARFAVAAAVAAQ